MKSILKRHKLIKVRNSGEYKNIKIIRVKENDWEIFKKIRLKSLKEEPIALRGSIQEEGKFSKQEWIEKIKGGYFFIALDTQKNTPVGIIGAYEKVEDGERNIYFSGFYVQKEDRGKGVGGKLIYQLAAHITSQASKFNGYYLWVRATQEKAISMYQKYGFKICEERTEPLPDGSECKKYKMKLQKINFLQFPYLPKPQK